jgi:hypothetical protein
MIWHLALAKLTAHRLDVKSLDERFRGPWWLPAAIASVPKPTAPGFLFKEIVALVCIVSPRVPRLNHIVSFSRLCVFA